MAGRGLPQLDGFEAGVGLFFDGGDFVGGGELADDADEAGVEGGAELEEVEHAAGGVADDVADGGLLAVGEAEAEVHALDAVGHGLEFEAGRDLDVAVGGAQLLAEDAAHAEHLVEHRLFEGRGGAVFGEGDGLAGGAELDMPLEAELGSGGDGFAGQRLQAVAAEGAAGVLDPRNGS